MNLQITVTKLSFMTEMEARLAQLQPVFKQWGAYLRAGAKAKISGGNFVPWAPSTIAKYRSQGSSSITAQATVRTKYAKALDSALRRKNQGVGRDELKRLLSDPSAVNNKATNKAVESLRKRLVKAKKVKEAGGKLAIGKRKAEKHKMLGKLGRLSAMNRGYTLRIEDKVSWSDVHNSGGTAGNGAVIPQRQYLAISEGAKEELAQIALRWFVEGKQGA